MIEKSLDPRSASPSLAAQPTQRFLAPQVAVTLACLCACLGVLLVYHSAVQLTGIWLTDDLKSMGLVVPFVSFALIVRAWRTLGWEMQGSWWGLVILAITAFIVFLQANTLFIVTVHKDWLLQLPPLPLVAVAYAAGMVLLFGGKKLLRAAWFPVVFMWAVIPVPQSFTRRIDLPLQYAAAAVARALAHALGQQLTPDKLHIMFTPEFGMFIVPGCNGIRGAITLGMAALIVGYVYRFRWFILAPVVAGAILLGYLFNFLRLCLLVFYYQIALHFPWLQNQGKMADYIIGGCLFVLALAIFFTVAERFRRDPMDVSPEPTTEASTPVPAIPFLSRVVVILALVLVFAGEWWHETRAQGPAVAIVPLPQQIGTYTLVRTWQDTLENGVVVYTWGEYAAQDPAKPHISLGISPFLPVHDAEVCHIARGEEPFWHGQINTPSPSGDISLSAAVYNDGVNERLEASTVCDRSGCHQYAQSTGRVTVVYARPERTLPLLASIRAVPVLITAQNSNPLLPAPAAATQLGQAIQEFLTQANLASLTSPYSGH